MHRMLVIAALLLAGCGPRPAPVTPAARTLADICAEPRTAERPPLLTEAVPESVRTWLQPYLTPAATPAEARARAESALASFRTLEDSSATASLDLGSMAVLYLQLLEAAYLLEALWPAEQAAVPTDLAPLLEPIYDGLRLPAILSGGFIQQLGGLAAQLLASAEAPDEVLLSVMQLLRILPERARVLQRHVALPLACDESAPPGAAVEALRHLAEAARDDGDWVDGLALRRELARRAPEDVENLYSLAQAAYRAGQAEEGDRATAAADERCAAPCEQRPSDIDRFAAAARTIAADEATADAETRLTLARAFETVGRNDEAKNLYADVAEELPDDARPRTGLARLAMVEAMDVATALPLLDGAGPDNRDGEYYELLVACRALAAVYIILPQLAQNPDRAADLLGPTVLSLHEATVAYMEFQPARASAILLLLEAVEQGMAGGGTNTEDAAGLALQTVAARALPLAERYPDSPEVAALVVSAALFGTAPDEVFPALERPLPGELGTELGSAVRRVGLYVHALLRWNDVDRLPRAAELIDQIPAAGAGASWQRLFRADRDAAGWRMGAGNSPETVRDGYLAAVDDPLLPVEQRPRALNNLAVALAALGDSGAAAERLRRAEESTDTDFDVPKFNRLALAVLAPTPAADALEGLRTYMTGIADDEGQPATMRRQSLRWLAWLADREGRADDARGFRERADAVPTSPFFPDPQRSDLGFLSRGTFQFGLGYSSLKGLVINLDTGSWVWLLLTPPASGT
jgi:hypothetical protein